VNLRINLLTAVNQQKECAMSVLNFGHTVSLQDFAKSIGIVGKDVTVIGQGEPGIGKSSMLKVLAQQYPDYEIAYIDCTLLDLGDFALPYTEMAGDMKVQILKECQGRNHYDDHNLWKGKRIFNNRVTNWNHISHSFF
jgi:hypothetical protein